MGAVVAGGGGAWAGRGRGDRQRKSSAWGAYRNGRIGGGECFRGGRNGLPPVAGGYLAGSGWRLKGVEVEVELQALDFVSNGCKID